MKKYLIVIEKGESNYSAFAPDVPGCTTTGKSIEQTMDNMKEALLGHIELLDEVPEPKGIEHHAAAGEFAPGVIEDDYIIAYVEVNLPETNNPEI